MLAIVKMDNDDKPITVANFEVYHGIPTSSIADYREIWLYHHQWSLFVDSSNQLYHVVSSLFARFLQEIRDLGVF